MKILTRVLNQVGVRIKFTTSTDGSSDTDGTNCALVMSQSPLNECAGRVTHPEEAFPITATRLFCRSIELGHCAE